MKGIRIRDLTKNYGRNQVLRGINLDLEKGELLALLGPSGCGKSTTLQMLAGFDKPTSGEIWIGDRLVSANATVVAPERRNISLVFQNYAVWPHKTVAENVAYGLQVRRLPRHEVTSRVTRALDTVHLTALRDRYPSELSGGQQQRVALARAMVVEPDILLLDEPLSNLDAHLREEMRYEIRQVHDLLGLTTVYVTHDQGEALVTADKIAVMRGGQVQQCATPESVFTLPSNTFVASFIGNNNELHGKLTEDGLLTSDGSLLRGEDRSGARIGEPVCLCIRPSAVKLGKAPECRSNKMTGTVMRVAYLGEFRDVLVDVGAGVTLRSFVSPETKLERGQAIAVHLPLDQCQILTVSTH
jgi:iron(III) transport system ATP-binding protein